jgi:hypothetical protein
MFLSRSRLAASVGMREQRCTLWAFASLFHASGSRSEPFPGPHPSENPP